MKNKLLPIQPGTKVRVSDGAPMPPARFKRKLADWENRNFDAIVVGEEAAGKYGAREDKYRLQMGDLRMRAYLIMLTARPASQVTALEEAPSYLVAQDGLDAKIVGRVDGGAW